MCLLCLTKVPGGGGAKVEKETIGKVIYLTGGPMAVSAVVRSCLAACSSDAWEQQARPVGLDLDKDWGGRGEADR